MQPADVDRLIEGVRNAMITGITRLIEAVYRWHWNKQVPIYIPPPEARPDRYEDQPKAVYEQREREE